MEMHDALVYDIEIERAIPGRDGRREPLVSYCEGWGDHAGMGVACIGVYDYVTGRSRVFGRESLGEFLELQSQRSLLVGFNSIPFDNAVLRTVDVHLHESRCYDILREMWAAHDLGPQFQFQTHAGFGLDATAHANFVANKTGNGAEAPIWWQRKEHCRVIDYCLNDVWLTKLIFDRVCAGELLSPKVDGKVLRMRPPFRKVEAN